MCVTCNNSGGVEFDYLQVRLDALPPDKTFNHAELLSFFESIGSPTDRHVVLCQCRIARTCSWHDGICEPVLISS